MFLLFSRNLLSQLYFPAFFCICLILLHSTICIYLRIHKQNWHFRYKSKYMSPSAGNSGMGCYHGKFTFDQLSHLRGCLIKQLKMEGVNNMRYPPHTAKKLDWARFFILRQVEVGKLARLALMALLVVTAAVMIQV